MKMSNENTMPAKDFFTGGLPAEDIYLFEVERMRVQEYTSQKDGSKYKKMLGTFVLLENRLGTYKGKDRVSESFPLYGKSLRRLANLHKAITGSTPVVVVNEAGEEVIDFDAIADGLNGGRAWGPLSWRKRQQRKDDGTYEDIDDTDAKFGWSFSDKPDGVRPSADLAAKLGIGK
jgi:hypothetical protein